MSFFGTFHRFRSGAVKVRVGGELQSLSKTAVAAAAPKVAVTAAVTLTPVSGTNNVVIYTADTAGTAGNGITVAYVISGAGATAAVTLSGTAITVTAGSTCTAQTVITAVNAHAGAAALVTATASGTVTGVVVAKTATALAGGVDATVATAGDTRVASGFLYVAHADVAVSSTAGWKKVALAAL
jgi:hypothetical protein